MDTAIETATTAFRAARFRDAAAALDGLTQRRTAAPAVRILRARLYLKMRDPAGALSYLATVDGRLPDAATCETALLRGSALARLGDERAASAQLDRAEKARPGGLLRAEIAYTRALNAWIARRLTQADRFLDRVDAPRGSSVDLEARALRGAVAGSRGRVAHQAALLLEALQCVHDDPGVEVLPWAVIAAQISYLARELPSPALRDAAFAQYDRVPWTPDLADYRFTMLHALAWRHALDGDYFSAFRRFKEARGAAPSDGWRVVASCDRAYLAAALGERRWSEQERSDAHELAGRVAWPSLANEERFALTLLAELFAPTDPALALAYLGRYREAGTRFDRLLASSDDRRVVAMEAYSSGVVHAALGERTGALRALEAAWKIYDEIGYDWRAGRTANALAALTDDDAWRTRAAEKLRPYPRSWLAGDAARRGVDAADARRLTAAQSAVYELLLQGLSTAQIAGAQGRSEFTVRNHIKAIFKAFGVRSRPALLAAANGRSPSART